MSWRAGLAKLVTGVVFFTMVSSIAIIDSPPASGATITQVSPTFDSVDVARSAAYTVTLAADPSFVGVTFANATLGFTITPGGVLSTPGPLSVAGSPYLVTGTDSDTSGDVGTWSYSLTVTPDTIIQTSPTPGSTDVAGSAAFTSTLNAASGFVGTVTFANPTLNFTITPGGVLSTPGPLTVAGSPYSVTGTDSDAYGDTGTWSYSLTVTPDTITQAPPTSGNTSPSISASFTSTLSAASGFVGTVTFANPTLGFTISNGDVLHTPGPLTVAGSPYSVTGTDSDAYGDAGTWTFSLTVVATPPTGGPPGSTTNIIQTSPTTGTVLNTAEGTFTPGPITVTGNTGPVTYLTTTSSPGLTVSKSGQISTTGPLAVGTYGVSGTDTDANGDNGTWTYTLTVTSAITTITFDANGGSGAMSPESDGVATALSLNGFTWARHTFVGWNTSANGSGVSYANGAVYPFTQSTTLFAQWKIRKSPSRTITFAAHGGAGTMASEHHRGPSAISANHYRRVGYRFVNWNTSPNGSGKRFRAGATYPFKTSVTLYAQWKKVSRPPSPVVVFVANGGAGTMASEHHRGPTPLTPNGFRRNGYRFIDWNSAANGSGASYGNGATYSFASSTTLYARWKKNKKVAPPPPKNTGPVIGRFGSGSTILSPLLENQIQNVANEVKANGDTQIALLGYGDKLTAANDRNLALWTNNIDLSRSRAQAVASYLQKRLAALGLKGWTISIAAAGAGKRGSSQSEFGVVIATLS